MLPILMSNAMLMVSSLVPQITGLVANHHIPVNIAEDNTGTLIVLSVKINH